MDGWAGGFLACWIECPLLSCVSRSCIVPDLTTSHTPPAKQEGGTISILILSHLDIMRGKRAGNHISSQQQTNPNREEDSNSGMQQTGPDSTSSSTSSSAFSSKRAADMFASYSNSGNTDLGGSGAGTGNNGEGEGDSSITPSTTTSTTASNGNASDAANGSNSGSSGASLSELKEGAERLANELDEYLSKSSTKPFFRTKDAAPLSDEAVADLQLATARKLREVSLAWNVELTDCKCILRKLGSFFHVNQSNQSNLIDLTSRNLKKPMEAIRNTSLVGE